MSKKRFEEIKQELEELGELEELDPEQDFTWGETEELTQERELGQDFEGDLYE